MCLEVMEVGAAGIDRRLFSDRDISIPHHQNGALPTPSWVQFIPARVYA